MANPVTKLDFPEVLTTEMFNTVRGKSAIAGLCGQSPIPFNGLKEFVFSMDGEASIVGEGAAKPAGSAAFTPVVIKPIKFIYQARVTDEFMHTADEARLGYLQAFADGFAKKIARGIDIAAIHGCDPKSKAPISSLATNCFDGLITNTVTYDANNPDGNLDAAIAAITAGERVASGLAISPVFGAQMAKVKVNGVVQYPEFRFGGAPQSFANFGLQMNTTVPFLATGAAKMDHGIIGDFANAFRWGYARNIPLEVIEYGDPDGAGRDLKQYNEVCLRAEAYIGWGILDAASFALIQATVTP